jgi:hypothetical protein
MLAELLRRIEYVRDPSGMPVLTRASFCAVGVDEGGSRSGAAEDQSRLRPALLSARSGPGVGAARGGVDSSRHGCSHAA